MAKIALITGISGQDGAYLAKFLLKKKYKIIGTVKKSSKSSYWRLERLGIKKKLTIEKMDLGNLKDIDKIFKKYDFNEVYNLAAQSFVNKSFNIPIATSNITGLGTLRILEIIKKNNRKIKFYQASSSEMFGRVLNSEQSETTPFNPQSPYAISKVFSHLITKNYRNSYKIFATSGILFNHESPLRGKEYVTRKIIIGLVKIYKKKLKSFQLGNIYAKRDLGYAKEYVVAMWKMMQKKKPKDYIISTGKTYSIKDFINLATAYLKLKTKWVGKGFNEKLILKKTNRPIITINSNLFRPSEVSALKGNSSKAKKDLKWSPKTNLKKLVKIMIDEELLHS
jgi:GDPmannose 4,6-dehydratase